MDPKKLKPEENEIKKGSMAEFSKAFATKSLTNIPETMQSDTNDETETMGNPVEENSDPMSDAVYSQDRGNYVAPDYYAMATAIDAPKEPEGPSWIGSWLNSIGAALMKLDTIDERLQGHAKAPEWLEKYGVFVVGGDNMDGVGLGEFASGNVKTVDITELREFMALVAPRLSDKSGKGILQTFDQARAARIEEMCTKFLLHAKELGNPKDMQDLVDFVTQILDVITEIDKLVETAKSDPELNKIVTEAEEKREKEQLIAGKDVSWTAIQRRNYSDAERAAAGVRILTTYNLQGGGFRRIYEDVYTGELYYATTAETMIYAKKYGVNVVDKPRTLDPKHVALANKVRRERGY
jgi:hypothetical protein